jgi:hypothetical protein
VRVRFGGHEPMFSPLEGLERSLSGVMLSMGSAAVRRAPKRRFLC